MNPSLLLPFLLAASLHAQQPPPPPPPDPGGSSGISGGNIDLSKIPVPEADRNTGPKLSATEARTKPVQISVVPIGPVPPPIIYLDASGMPREKYRQPLEYPPASYHIATEHGTIRLTGAQNQVATPTAIPRRTELLLSYEIPAGEEGADPADKGPRLKTIGTIAVPPGATHLVVALWKDPSAGLWKSPQFKVIDVSPGTVKQHEALIFNVSGRELAIQRGDVPYRIRSGFMGKIALPVNQRGEMPMLVSAATDVGWQQLSHTVIGPDKDERIFVIAWQAPNSPAQPSGVSLQAIAKRLPEAKPFALPKDG